MTDKRITQLPSATTLNGTEIVPMVQSGTNVKATTQDIATLVIGDAGLGSAALANTTQFDPAGAAAAVEAGLNSRRLASGTVASPVPNIALSLALDCDYFVLNITHCTIGGSDTTGTNDNLTMVLSQDNGVTWLCDSSNTDTYLMSGNEISADYVTGVVAGGDNAVGDSLIDLFFINLDAADHTSYTNIPASIEVQIFPGSASELPNGKITARWNGKLSGTNKLVRSNIDFVLNPSATVAPTKARITNITVRPYCDGITPQGTNLMIQPGTKYELRGITL